MKDKIKTDDLKLADKQFEKMTKTPINKLIVSLALPTVISMMITTIYNIADTYFVSKISVSASGAIGVVFSLMAILQAFGFMFGHGSGSCISRQLGSKQIEKARRFASTGAFLALICGIAIMALGLIFIKPFMTFLGSTKTILPYAVIYARYILIAGPAMTTSCVLNNILRYEGKASLAMIGLATGGILNIILDPIFIFGFKMGITGAGLSTALSQYISVAILYFMFKIGKTESKLSFKYVTLNFAVIKEIVLTGLPSLARQGLNSVSNMALNICAAPYGDAAIAALSIVAKCSNFIFSIAVGIGQGFQPVSAFNYGAKKYDRVKKGMKFTHIFSTSVVAVIALVCFVFAKQVIGIFRSDTQVIDIGAPTLKYMCVAILFLPTIMIANMTFQSVGKSGRAFFLACLQNGLLFIPLLYILPHFFGLTGLELSQSIAYVLSAGVSVPFTLSFTKQLSKS